jgi:hypothetical protein
MRSIALPLGFALGLVLACGGGDGRFGENAGSACEAVDDCYPDVDHDELQGDVECMDRVEGGYCTHTCQTDADCCAVDGECESGLTQVCAPFENSDTKRCFVACEGADVEDYDGTEDEYCQEFAHSELTCRSTGGGSENRKVCMP